MRHVLLLPLLALIVLAGCELPDDPMLSAGGAASEGRVERVVDGDTVIVRLAGARERVRLIGVDTPETVKPGSPVECFGKAASKFAHGLLDGERVRLEQDAEARDRYGRLLAYVHRIRDDLFVNAELVRRGYAQPLTIPPNVRHADEFAALARAARANGRGLWGACDG
jgi:micrococcal nuclease